MNYSINSCSLKTTPPTSGGCNFLASCAFLLIFSAIDAPRGRLHLLLGHHEQWGLLQKRQANLTLSDPSWAIYSTLLIIINVDGIFKLQFFLEKHDFTSKPCFHQCFQLVKRQAINLTSLVPLLVAFATLFCPFIVCFLQG